MALREFTDAGGRHWSVWEVNPSPNEALVEQLWRSTAARPAWLAFECQVPPIRRRLSPYPAGWAELSDDALTRLCDQATEVATRRRLTE